MTASKRHVPVSLVCLLIASTYTATTNPAKAGPSSSLDPYATIQAPTAKELEDKNNKARAKKGLPPIHKGQATSSTKVEDTSSTTTYVTAPGGGNGKAIKQNSAVAESGTGGGKLFGKFPKIGLPSMPSLPVLGKGKAKANSEQEPEVAVAKPKKEKGPKIAANKTETKVVKETPVGEEIETAATASSPSVANSGSESEGNVVTKTLKATTNGMVNGSKKVGNGIASGAKASGNVIAKGASMVCGGFKATGEKIKGGTGKIATIGMPHMPNPFHKKNKGGSTEVALATSPAVAGGEPSLGSPRKPGAAHSQNELLKQSKASATPSKSTHLPETDELVSEQSIAAGNNGAKGGLAGMSEKMNSTFSKLNPFSKKGIAGKKQKQTL